MSGTLSSIAAIGALILAGCAAPEPDQAVDSAGVLAEHDLDDLDATELIEHLDTMAVTERPTDLMASVRPDSVVVTDANTEEETEVEVPDDMFYVSMAPYVTQTHDCYFHSLTTCLGELRGEEVDVTITDDATGEVLVDETTTTFDNGFLGYWLPRDIDATVTTEHAGKTGSLEITTGDDDPTCLTDLQLA